MTLFLKWGIYTVVYVKHMNYAHNSKSEICTCPVKWKETSSKVKCKFPHEENEEWIL